MSCQNWMFHLSIPCIFRQYIRLLYRQTDRHSAAHQTHTCAMTQSLTQMPLIKMTFLPYGGAIRPTRCVIPKIEALEDKSTLYITVTLNWGYLIVLWVFHLVRILCCGCFDWVCNVCVCVLVICVLVFTVFCIVCTVFLYCFVYVYYYLLCLY